MGEIERIQSRYVERDQDATLSSYWSLTNPVAVHLMHERERAALRGINQAGVELGRARLLDVGCGRAQEFASYVRWGAQASNLYGVDLSERRLRDAQAQGIGCVALASAAGLPFADACFDIVVQNVVFSSVIDQETRKAIAAEMLRVLRPGGWILWYDAVKQVSRDPHFRAVPVKDVEEMFPGVKWQWQRLTMHLGVLDRVHRYVGERAMQLIDVSGLLKTHRFGCGRRQS